MDRALSPSSGLHLDPRRIAATSVAILVHAGVLMLLLMPTATRDAPREEQVIEVSFQPRRIPPPPPPPPIERPPQQVVRHAAPAPTPIADPPIAPVDDTPAPIDTYVPEATVAPPTDFSAAGAAPVFAQIVADRGPVPPYPAAALKRRIAGQVVLRIRVDASGRPVEVGIETSSGSALLDEAAARFVKARWHFVPAMRDGQPVEALALLPVNFSLPR
jgi:protein TonB